MYTQKLRFCKFYLFIFSTVKCQNKPFSRQKQSPENQNFFSDFPEIIFVSHEIFSIFMLPSCFPAESSQIPSASLFFFKSATIFSPNAVRSASTTMEEWSVSLVSSFKI